MDRAARVERPGEMSGGGAEEHLGLLFMSSTSVRKISSHPDTNRRNKGLLIPPQPHPLAWHQLCASSLQLAACPRRPQTDIPAFEGADSSSSSINPQDSLPLAHHRTGIMPTLQALCVSPGMGSRNLIKETDCPSKTTVVLERWLNG